MRKESPLPEKEMHNYPVRRRYRCTIANSPCTPAEFRVDQLRAPEDRHADAHQVSAISGSSSIVALRGRLLHLAGSYDNDGIWVGAYVDDEDLQLAKRGARSSQDPEPGGPAVP